LLLSTEKCAQNNCAESAQIIDAIYTDTLFCIAICIYTYYHVRMTIQVEGFDWDEGNIAKCQKHGLSTTEIEAFFRGDVYFGPDIKHSIEEQRFLAVGRSPSGRPMFVAFTLRNGLIRPISARYMREKEAKKYEETAKNDNR
jgi:uncharacterized DUF497 family protein